MSMGSGGATDAVRRAGTAVLDGWNDFWFRPEPTSTLAVFRIAYGLLLLLWAASIGPDIITWFSNEGIFPEPSYRPWYLTLLQLSDAPGVVIAIYVALVLGALGTLFGYRTRLSTVVAFLAYLSLIRRNAFILNGGDRLIANLGLYLMLAPAGVALSLDRWRRDRASFWTFPARAMWPMRLVQIQVSLMYFFTVWHKVRGDTWSEGTAMWYPWQIGDLQRLSPPHALIESLVVVNLLTWGTLAVELALAILVWNRRLRPWVIAAGVALHLSIEVTMMIGFFSFAVFVAYIAFASPEAMERVVDAVRRRLTRSRFAALRHVAQAPARPSAGSRRSTARARQKVGAGR